VLSVFGLNMYMHGSAAIHVRAPSLSEALLVYASIFRSVLVAVYGCPGHLSRSQARAAAAMSPLRASLAAPISGLHSPKSYAAESPERPEVGIGVSVYEACLQRWFCLHVQDVEVVVSVWSKTSMHGTCPD
jgi:hypothetical protein